MKFHAIFLLWRRGKGTEGRPIDGPMPCTSDLAAAAWARDLPCLRCGKLEHKNALARGLRVEEPVRFLGLVKGEAVGEHTIHRDLAVGDKAGAVSLPHCVKRPGRKNGELLADHVWTDVDGDVIAFTDKTDRAPGTCAAHGSNAGLRGGTTIECQISPFAVRQVFDRRNGISGLRIDGDVGAK